MRVTRSTVDGASSYEVDGASNGRGAWVCRNEDGRASPQCLDAAVGSKQFGRAWKTSLDEEDIKAIRRAVDDSPVDE